LPLPDLRTYLAKLKLEAGADPDRLVFGNGRPFSASGVTQRAHRVWTKAKLAPIGLHECRHTYASTMIAAGVNVKALSTYMGHASTAITWDRYGHLMPGNEEQAVACVTAYLAEQRKAAATRAIPGLKRGVPVG
jgi:integrase